MAVRFQCDNCGKKLKASDDKIGRRVVCSGCGNPVSVPESDTAAVEDIAQQSAGGDAASSSAGDLLKQSVAAGRSAEAEETTSGGGVVVVETAKYVAVRFVPGLVGILLVAYLAYWLSTQVMSTGPHYPELGKVSGTVTLNGEPLAGARILFQPVVDPQAENQNIAASVGQTDENGYYTLVYVRDVKGAAVGEHTVKINARGENGQELVPPKYSKQAKVVREVQPGKNTIDFALKTTGR